MRRKAFLYCSVVIICILCCLLTSSVNYTEPNGIDTPLEVTARSIPEPTENIRVDVRTEFIAEAGIKFISAQAFLKNVAVAVFVKEPSTKQLSTPGSYPLEIMCSGKTYSVTLIVKDSLAPEGDAVNISVPIGKRPEPEQFVTNIRDASEVFVKYKETPDVSVSGEFSVTLILSDTYGNTAELTALLIVLPDTVPPTISGVKPIRVYVGDTVHYRQGISVTDDTDPSPKLTIDSSQVNLKKPGTYKIIYTATDASGNITKVESTVKVISKKVQNVSDEEIYRAADALLAKIIKDGMTKKEQAEAIYKWARGSCHYVSKPNPKNYMLAAYDMLKSHCGDCYNYFSVSKLLFKRLNIVTIDVVKVKNSPHDSEHFWNLVSLDGGVTWYHFDATPRRGPGDDFCLVTDAFIDAYSEAHHGSHNRDKSLYPPTPEE